MDDRDSQPYPYSQATRSYNPYRDLNAPIQNLYHLSTSPEFLFEEESNQRRSCGENLVFYTGSAYVGGSIAGGTTGFFSAFKAFEAGDTLKIKLNRILNSTGHSGRTWGNRVGTLGLIYAVLESGAIAALDRNDKWTSIAAGLGAGALYWAPKGVRPAALAGAVGAVAAGAVAAGKPLFRRYLPF